MAEPMVLGPGVCYGAVWFAFLLGDLWINLYRPGPYRLRRRPPAGNEKLNA